MKKFIVADRFVRFFEGALLHLTKEQMSIREHCLKVVKKSGKCLVESKIEFKQGEEIGIYGDVPKAMINKLEEKTSKKSKSKKKEGQSSSDADTVEEDEKDEESLSDSENENDDNEDQEDNEDDELPPSSGNGE